LNILCFFNKNVDIKISAHDAFLEYLHLLEQNQKIGQLNNLKVLRVL